MKLLQLQNDFQEYLLQMNKAIQCHVIGTEKLSIETRLAIYENAYYARLVNALETTYPILKKYLGDENFNQLARVYAHRYHSHYRSIRWFGDQLSQFLEKDTRYQTLPYLAELAQFEWIMSLVFDAADAHPLGVLDVEKIPIEQWEYMRFQTHPSLHTLNLQWNVIAIWQALSDDETPVPFKKNQPSTWVAWRQELISQFCSLTPEEDWALHAMLMGKTFGEICEGLCQWKEMSDVSLYAASLLKGWVIAGFITQIYFS